jgi:nicotinamide-nucleotide amidase
MPTIRIELLVDRLAARMRAHGLSLVTAESCTGGALAATIVSHPSASGMLERGFVVYSPESKCELLGLDRRQVERCDGVSEEVARSLASAALRNSHAHLSAAITGFAGPRTGKEEVGLVHIAVGTAGATYHQVLHLGDIGRDAVTMHSIATALEMLISHVPRAAAELHRADTEHRMDLIKA